MSVVKINAITVPADRAGVMAQRFLARAVEVGKSDRFEEFQVPRPADERMTWLVYTRWRDEPAFEAWRTSQASRAKAKRPMVWQVGPVATGSELWSYPVEQRELAI